MQRGARKTIRRVHRRGDPYPVLLGKGLLGQAGHLLRVIWDKGRVGVITHLKLARLLGTPFIESLRDAGFEVDLFFMGEGERSKTLENVCRLYTRLIRAHYGRDDRLVALGGGVVGDTAGFVAATYLRGLELAQIPTTLLSQIDSSVGAKVGVNLPQGKNLVGAIYRPRAVFIDPEVLTTLPARELHSGLFELLKYGFIGSSRVFRQIERAPEAFRPQTDLLYGAIATAVRMKLDVVREDERESGPRRVLNFGHTVGHGLEVGGDYRRLSHGEAVGWGMIAAVRLAYRRKLIGSSLADRMESAIRGVAPLPSLAGFRLRRVLGAVDKDKKIGKRGFRFVLPLGIGRVRVVEGVSRDEIRWAVESLGVGAR